MSYRQFPKKVFIAELLGSFVLIATILFGAEHFSGAKLALLISGMLMVIIYLAAPFSKAHFNPAVTLAFYLRKEISGKLVGVYLLAEILGALAAFYLFNFMVGFAELKNIVSGVALPILLAEFAGTVLLVSVIMAVATLKVTKGHKYYGFVIALAVLISIILFGNVSGSHINPIVSLVAASKGQFTLWVFLQYLILQFLAAIFVALVFNKLFGFSHNG